MIRYIENVFCDACNNLLEGVQGMATIRKDYLRMPGSTTLRVWNDGNQQYFNIYLGKSNESLTFCNAHCFETLMLARKTQFLPGLLERYAGGYRKHDDRSLIV